MRWPSMPSIHSRASLAAAGVYFSSRSRFKSRSKDMVMVGWLCAVGSDTGLRRGSPGTFEVASSFHSLSTGNRKRRVSGGWRLAAAGWWWWFSQALTSVFRGDVESGRMHDRS